MTLGHLETKLHASKLLSSPAEYKQALLIYAKRLADEGFRAKAEELIKELFGPVYWLVFISSLFTLAFTIFFLSATSGDQEIRESTNGLLLSLASENANC